METYLKDNEPLKLIKEAINISAHGETFHNKMMLFSQSMGFQGLKRLHRYNSEKDRKHYVEMQNYCIDMFGEVLEPDWNYSISTPRDLKDILNDYLKWEISVYKRINDIGDKLISYNCTCEYNLVTECLYDVRKEIEKVRRMIQEYSMSGWDMSYILIKDKKLHDEMKEKENIGE